MSKKCVADNRFQYCPLSNNNNVPQLFQIYRFNNLNQQQTVNHKNNVNNLNQRMAVLGLKASEASLLHAGSAMNSSGAVTNSQQEAQQLCGPQDSLYKIDYLMDPRKSVSIEQLAAYVSS